MPQFKDSSLGQKIQAKSWNYGPVVGLLKELENMKPVGLKGDVEKCMLVEI